MDLKNTKVTEPLTTANAFKDWALENGIVKLSPASKNISGPIRHLVNQRLGRNCEQKVIKHFTEKGWTLQFQRAKTSIAEVDLIFQRDRRICLVEVKSLDNPWRSFQRISHRQIQKLILNQIHLSAWTKDFEFYCWLAFVSPKQIHYTKIN
jgi:Holliday junction resolvase-like predicted endonuclease